MMVINVKPIATPIGTRRISGDVIHPARGESGCCRSVANPAADTMKSPRQTASIAYSGQWALNVRVIGRFDARTVGLVTVSPMKRLG